MTDEAEDRTETYRTFRQQDCLPAYCLKYMECLLALPLWDSWEFAKKETREKLMPALKPHSCFQY
jgi:hypothetical protein